MPVHTQRLVLVLSVSLCVSWPGVARAQRVTQAEYLSVVTDMITELAPRSAHAAAAIRETYRPFIGPLALDTFDDIARGLATGGLVPLSSDAERFNVHIRRDGPAPIGEMDVVHQDSYISARASTIGCLIDVASRVKSGPIEVTSLVRHLEYQNDLRAMNANATTDVPTHALGLAFDIAMVNTPLATILELEDVLREMSDAGDILVIAERQQMVFHVVPQPSRLGWYSEVYARAINGQTWGRAGDGAHFFTPTVSATIASLQPMPRWAAEWWAADNVPLEMALAVSVRPEETLAAADSSVRDVTGYVVLRQFLASTWHRMLPWTLG